MEIISIKNTVLNGGAFASPARVKIALLAVGITLVLLWNFYAVWRVFSWAHMPDELWFYSVALHNYRNPDFVALFSENSFSYGGVWFAIYDLIIRICDSFFIFDYATLVISDTTVVFSDAGKNELMPMFLMRLVNLVGINTVLLCCIISLARGQLNAVFALFFLISSPMLFWSGKWASPDFLACSLLFLGLWFYNKRKFVCYLAFGLALGIKLSVIPFVIAFFLIDFVKFVRCSLKLLKKKKYGLRRGPLKNILSDLRASRTILQFYTSMLVVIIAFIGCNLFMLTNLEQYLNNIEQFTSAFGNENAFKSFDEFLASLSKRLFEPRGPLWDLTYAGSLSYWSTNPYLMLVVLVISLISVVNKSLHVAILLGFVIGIVLLARQPAFGWNWFPFIFAFAIIYIDLKPSLALSGFYIGVTVLGLVLSFDNIKTELKTTFDHHHFLTNYRFNKFEYQRKINDFIRENDCEKKRVFNLIEVGIKYPDSYSYANSYWNYLNRFSEGDMILVGDRTMQYIGDAISERLEGKFYYSSGKVDTINIYCLESRRF